MYRYVKRAFDILSSVLALVILSPIFMISIILIKVTSPGPIFYLASRSGKGNKLFKMYKFRSMTVDKDADEKNFKADAARIFPWGRFMRGSKIDELPQLINVLKGDMSIIGPRPASIDQLGVVRNGEYAVISKLKPGLSSPSALYDYIYGDTIEDEMEYEEKVLPTRLNLDVYYTKKQSIFYDIKIIWYTIVSVFAYLFHRTPERILKELEEASRKVDNKINRRQGNA